MKIAIIGKISQKTSFQNWVSIYRHHLWRERVSQFNITGADSLLNKYVRKYASLLSIPIAVYDDSHHDDEAKLNRNAAMLQESDLVIAFTTELDKESSSDKPAVTINNGKKALIINVDEYKAPPRKIIRRARREHVTIGRNELPSDDEILSLVTKIQQSPADSDAEKQKLTRHLHHIVRRFAERYATPAHLLDELIAEGNAELIRAATEYDPSRGSKFILHAACRILQKIKQALTNQ